MQRQAQPPPSSAGRLPSAAATNAPTEERCASTAAPTPSLIRDKAAGASARARGQPRAAVPAIDGAALDNLDGERGPVRRFVSRAKFWVWGQAGLKV